MRSQRDDFQSDGSEKKTLEREKEEKGRTSPISGEFADNMETHTLSSLTWDLQKVLMPKDIQSSVDFCLKMHPLS